MQVEPLQVELMMQAKKRVPVLAVQPVTSRVMLHVASGGRSDCAADEQPPLRAGELLPQVPWGCRLQVLQW
jgi:hypothetical protein